MDNSIETIKAEELLPGDMFKYGNKRKYRAVFKKFDISDKPHGKDCILIISGGCSQIQLKKDTPVTIWKRDYKGINMQEVFHRTIK